MASNKYTKIGFIGLGHMGYPMCENLVKKTPDNTKFFVYDVVQAPVDKMCSAFAGKVTSVGSAKEVAEKSEVIISIVPEGSHVRSVYLTPDTGVLAADVSGKLLIDSSTIDTTTTLLVNAEVKKQYPTASFYDAPVSGGEIGAQRATLAFMCGCAEDDPQFPVLQHLLGMMGASVIACGGQSLGVVAKLCNNYCSSIIALATSEAMDIGMKNGMNPQTLANVFHNSAAQSTICDDFCPVPGISPAAPASKGYKPGFAITLMRKDINLAVDAGNKVGANMILGNVNLKTYTEAMNDPKCKGLDSRVVFRFIGGNEDWDGKMAEREALGKQ